MGEDRVATASEETKLRYLDRLTRAAVSISTSFSRVFFLSCVLSALILAICTGAVSFEQEYSVAGLRVQISQPAFVWIGGGTLAILGVTLFSLLKRLGGLLDEIDRLYKDLNYTV